MTDPALLELLTEIRDKQERGNMLAMTLIEEMRGLRVDIQTAGRRPRKAKTQALSSADVAILADLLPAIVAAVGAESVTVRALEEATEDRTAEARSLRKALDATGMNGMQLGKLFARASKCDTPTADLYVHRIGDARDGVVIRVDANHRDHHIAHGVAAALRGKLST